MHLRGNRGMMMLGLTGTVLVSGLISMLRMKNPLFNECENMCVLMAYEGLIICGYIPIYCPN